MKKILKIFSSIIIVAILGVIIYQSKDAILSRLTPFINGVATELGIKSAPCAEPIPYTLGTFDTQFGISKDYFLESGARSKVLALSPDILIWPTYLGSLFSGSFILFLISLSSAIPTSFSV